MTVQDPPLFLQADPHPAKYFRQMLSALTGVPLGAFSSFSTVASGGGGHGVVNESDLLVTENGTPNMSVNVAAGRAFIHGTEGADQGVYLATNDATVNVAIATADGTNPRKDIVVMQVRDAGGGYSGSSNDARIFVVTGTPAASPVDPTLPVNSVPLARVDVPASDTAITNSQITDLRRRTRALGGVGVCTSTTRPTGAAIWPGLQMWETDTKRVIIYDGTGWLAWDTQWQSYTATLTNLTLGNGTRTSRYMRQGPNIQVDFAFVLGSTSAVGSGPQFGLPFTATDPLGEAGLAAIGTASLLDTGSAQYDGCIRLEAGLAACTLHVLGGSGTTPNIRISAGSISATVPHTWAATDRIHVPMFKVQLASPYV